MQLVLALRQVRFGTLSGNNLHTVCTPAADILVLHMLRLIVTHLLSLCGLQEKPGLRLMQYKSMIFERWQRDPRNPRNQKVDP